MKKYKIYYFQIPIFLLVISCGALSDVNEKLGDGYTYIGEGGRSNFIFYSRLESNSNTIDEVSIYPAVKNYRSNSNYIIVYQKPDSLGVFNRLIAKNDSIRTDSLLRHDAYFKIMFKNPQNYWIIQKKTRSIYGPFTKQEYLAAGKKLNLDSKFLEEILKDEQ